MLSFVWEHLDDTLQFSNHTKFHLGSCYFILAIFILFSERYIVEGTCKYLVTILYSYVQFQIMIFFFQDIRCNDVKFSFFLPIWAMYYLFTLRNIYRWGSLFYFSRHFERRSIGLAIKTEVRRVVSRNLISSNNAAPEMLGLLNSHVTVPRVGQSLVHFSERYS